MKLSFSIKGWDGYSWDELVETAVETGFQGIELHTIHGADFMAKGGPFHKYNSAATMRRMHDKKLSIPCIDACVNLAKDSE